MNEVTKNEPILHIIRSEDLFEDIKIGKNNLKLKNIIITMLIS